jgi:hypothetical protein
MVSKRKPDSMKPVVYFAFLLSLFSGCTYHDSPANASGFNYACDQCGKTVDQMDWLETLFQKAQEDPSAQGNIYLVEFDGEIIFIHQPIIMSCMPCQLYNCDGDKIDNSTIDLQALADKMNSAHTIFRYI